MQNNNIQKVKKFGLSLIVVFLWLILTFLTFNNYVFAGNWSRKSGLNNTAKEMGYQPDKNNNKDIANTIGLIINSFLVLLGLIFMFLIWLGAFDLLGSGGNEELVKQGKGKIKNGAIGILIIFSAYLLAKVVIDIASSGVYNIGIGG